MGDRATKVIGYFAYFSPDKVICTDPQACIIAGSERAMREYIEECYPGRAAQAVIKKTRFGEILQGLRLGAAYGFDEESYGRFYPLGRQEGLPIAAADFASQRDNGSRFFTVQLAYK